MVEEAMEGEVAAAIAVVVQVAEEEVMATEASSMASLTTRHKWSHKEMDCKTAASDESTAGDSISTQETAAVAIGGTDISMD